VVSKIFPFFIKAFFFLHFITLQAFFKYFFACYRELFLWRRKITLKQRIKGEDLSLRSRWPHDVPPSRLCEGSPYPPSPWTKWRVSSF